MSFVGAGLPEPAPSRRAGPGDERAVADVLFRSRRAAAGAIPAAVHSDAEIREWVSATVIPEREVWLTEDGDGRPVAVLVLDGDWVDQLYVEPTFTGRGLGLENISAMSTDSSALFTRLAPVLNVSDLAGERDFYERLGVPVIYMGDEYPDFVAFGTDTIHFGIQQAAAPNDPPTVLTWQIAVADIDEAADRCRHAGLDFEVEHNNPAPGWSYRRLILRTPSGYRLALEGGRE